MKQHCTECRAKPDLCHAWINHPCSASNMTSQQIKPIWSLNNQTNSIINEQQITMCSWTLLHQELLEMNMECGFTCSLALHVGANECFTFTCFKFKALCACLLYMLVPMNAWNQSELQQSDVDHLISISCNLQTECIKHIALFALTRALALRFTFGKIWQKIIFLEWSNSTKKLVQLSHLLF